MAVTQNKIVTPQRIHCENNVAITSNVTMSDSPTNTVLIYTATIDGSRVTRITATPRATVTATQLQLYREVSASSNKRLFKSAAMSAYTMAATTAVPEVDFGYSENNPLILAPGEKLYAAIGVTLAGGIVFQVDGADY